jgi:hypothetical protein
MAVKREDRMCFTQWIAAGLLLMIGCVRMNAGTVVFSNLGQPGDTFGPDGISFGNNPYFPPKSTTGIVATRFYVSADSVLDSVETVPLLYSGPSDFNAYLIAEINGLPSQVIETVHFTNLAPDPQWPVLTPIFFSSRELLISGTHYWFGLSAGADTWGNWLFTPFYGDTAGSSNFAIGLVSGGNTSSWNLGTGGPLGREGAFRVIADPVPEPVSSMLVLTGLLGILVAGSRKP